MTIYIVNNFLVSSILIVTFQIRPKIYMHLKEFSPADDVVASKKIGAEVEVLEGIICIYF